jgi:hypothetical protein
LWLLKNEKVDIVLNYNAGRLVYSCKLNAAASQKTVPVSALPDGFYLYHFKPENEKASNGRITIIR